jgi:hypothetical protein
MSTAKREVKCQKYWAARSYFLRSHNDYVSCWSRKNHSYPKYDHLFGPTTAERLQNHIQIPSWKLSNLFILLSPRNKHRFEWRSHPQYPAHPPLTLLRWLFRCLECWMYIFISRTCQPQKHIEVVALQLFLENIIGPHGSGYHMGDPRNFRRIKWLGKRLWQLFSRNPIDVWVPT